MMMKGNTERKGLKGGIGPEVILKIGTKNQNNAEKDPEVEAGRMKERGKDPKVLKDILGVDLEVGNTRKDREVTEGEVVDLEVKIVI